MLSCLMASDSPPNVCHLLWLKFVHEKVCARKFLSSSDNKQGRLCAYNLTLRHAQANIVAVEKQ